MKENYTDLTYILSSIAAMVIFSASFVIYLFFKRINVYLVVFGLIMLGIGFVMKKRLDKTDGK